MPCCLLPPLLISLATTVVYNSTQPASTSVQPVTEPLLPQDLPDFFQAIEKNFENSTVPDDLEQQIHLKKVVKQCWYIHKDDCGIVKQLNQMSTEYENELAELKANYNENIHKAIVKYIIAGNNDASRKKWFAASELLMKANEQSQLELKRKFSNKRKDLVYSFNLQDYQTV